MMSIKELRKKRGITQRELAELVGVQPSIISRYESGKLIPPLKKMQALAEVFEVDTQDFIFSDGTGPDVVIEVRKKNPDYEWYKRLLLLASQGKCELCKEPAPFKDKEGKPYLQLFEIEKDYSGDDYSKNYVALCPNCFQRLKVLCEPNEIEKIKKIAENHEF